MTVHDADKNLSITNTDIANSFSELADYLEALGDNPYKIRAYRRAARAINRLPGELSLYVTENRDLTSIPSIGKAIAAKILGILKNKRIPSLQEFSPSIKTPMNELSEIKGLGPKKIETLINHNIRTKTELWQAIERGGLQNIKGFNQKLIEQIKNPTYVKKSLRFFHAAPIIESLVRHLRALPYIENVIAAGEYRRRQEVIYTFEILVVTNSANNLMKGIDKIPFIKSILNKTPYHIKLILHVDIILHLRIIHEKALASNLLYYTGSKHHFKNLKKIAGDENLELNKSGLFKQGTLLSASDERHVYTMLGLSYIEPELRENCGELEAAKKHSLPNLVSLDDIKGDLHCHTNETDGSEPLEVMVRGAFERGYQYVAITDHSQRLKITNGLDEKRLLEQIKLIDKLNEGLNDIVILKSIEVDILEDGSLDLPNSILKELDLTVCSIHSYFKLPIEKQTDRIIKAMDNPYFNILGHPTGRLINKRKPYAIDVEKIVVAAKERGCFLELNGQPYRLDLNDSYCRMAKKAGVKMAITSDAHSLRNFDYMKYGIYQARRGWLEPDDVINTRDIKSLLKLVKRN